MVSLPFANRLDAGRLLGHELARQKVPDEAVVLGLARGGIPVGFAVADRLRLRLEVIVVRKLGVPWQKELAMGAIAGTERILDRDLIQKLGIWDEDLNEIVGAEQAELKRREDLYRGDRAGLDLKGRTVLLVDDGLATGNTMLVAVHHVRGLEPTCVIVAVPVGSRHACDLVRRQVDRLVCLAAPEPFMAVGEWYVDFPQVGDEEVRKLLANNDRQFMPTPDGAIKRDL